MNSKILTFVLVISTSILFAQSITNINPAQRTDGSMIADISYDLAGPEPDYIIIAEASFDEGVTFTQINSVNGDVGEGIVPGIGKAIVWNFGSEFPDQYSATTQIRLTASLLWNCGDDIVDDKDSQTYATVEIGTQCWMAENLNIGTMINGSSNQTDNATIEKYCYSDNTSNCDTYGGLYQWNEMMQYTTILGAKGICPTGWHIPTDAEWCTLENEVDADTIPCNLTGWRGIDAGGNLKEDDITHWIPPNTGATNSSGFTGLPGGYRNTDGTFSNLTFYAPFWSSSNGSDAWFRSLHHDHAQVGRVYLSKSYGFSVRCVQD